MVYILQWKSLRMEKKSNFDTLGKLKFKTTRKINI